MTSIFKQEIRKRLFFDKDSFKALYKFGYFLVRALESRKQTLEIKEKLGTLVMYVYMFSLIYVC